MASDCSHCGVKPKHAFAASVCQGAYEGELREVVLRTKLPAEFPLTAALAELLFESVGETIAPWRVDRVVAMPMHWMRRFLRGGNGPELIAQRLAGRLGVVASSRLLVRRRNTPPQASLPPSARQANVRGAFRVRRPGSVQGSRILLVDDVMTTGATCREAASTLIAAGAAAVFVAVLARADS
ncbi:MAG: phosphoribosyltransferase family protein [Pirellulales bacterium]